jgi:hypothetical protein
MPSNLMKLHKRRTTQQDRFGAQAISKTTNLLYETCNYDSFNPLQQCRNLTPKEKPMMDERLKAMRTKGIEMMAQGYT